MNGAAASVDRRRLPWTNNPLGKISDRPRALSRQVRYFCLKCFHSMFSDSQRVIFFDSARYCAPARSSPTVGRRWQCVLSMLDLGVPRGIIAFCWVSIRTCRQAGCEFFLLAVERDFGVSRRAVRRRFVFRETTDRYHVANIDIDLLQLPAALRSVRFPVSCFFQIGFRRYGSDGSGF